MQNSALENKGTSLPEKGWLVPMYLVKLILFPQRKSIKKNFVFAPKRQRFRGFAPGNKTSLFIGKQHQDASPDASFEPPGPPISPEPDAEPTTA